MKTFSDSLLSIKRRLWLYKLKKLRKQHMNCLLSLEQCMEWMQKAEQIFNNPNTLTPCTLDLIGDSRSLRDSEVAHLLGDVELGRWSLTVDVIGWLNFSLKVSRKQL